jgi:hypothetical protein
MDDSSTRATVANTLSTYFPAIFLYKHTKQRFCTFDTYAVTTKITCMVFYQDSVACFANTLETNIYIILQNQESKKTRIRFLMKRVLM